MTTDRKAAEARLFEALAEATPELAEAICLACEERIETYRVWRDRGEGHRLRETIPMILGHFAASPASAQVPGPLEGIGALRATQGLPLEAIPTAWLIISEHVWRWVVGRSVDEPDLDLTVLWTRFLDYVRASAGTIQASYVKTRSEAYATEVMVARATLDQLLSETSPEETEAELVRSGHRAATMRLFLSRHPDPAVDPITDRKGHFKKLLARFAELVGQRVLPWTVWDDVAVVVLPPELGPRQVTDVLAQVRGDIRAVLSRLVPTASAIRPLLTQTLPLLALTRADRPFVDVDGLSLLEITAAKASVTPEEMPAWTPRFFADAERHEHSWSETVRELVSAHLNVGQTAQALHVHQNTVYYRLEAIKKHCGVDVREPDAVADLQLAMQLRSLPRRTRVAESTGR